MLEHEQSYLPIVQTPFVTEDTDLENGESHHDNNAPKPLESSQRDLQTPNFRRFQQATNIELFYDLFFVANLTAFTYVHDINDIDSLKQYMGFFCLLWFTWYQVSLYDVRFVMDSVFERIAKLGQLLVMIGFALVGPQFNPGEESTGDDDNEAPNFLFFKAMTLILMTSRLILVVQYLQTLWFSKSYKKMLIPMLLYAGTYFAAAMIYLGLFWTFTPNLGPNHSYIVWYVIAVLETLMITSVSVVWRNLSFVETHLVERMSLLTLIILGEGAIAITKSCQYIVFSNGIFPLTSSVTAYIFCAVCNLYFMYMIYFDWLHEELFGTIRQQIWSFLHFPLHLAMVLALEGQSQTITWNAAVQKNDELQNMAVDWFRTIANNVTANDFLTVATQINNTANELIAQQLTVSTEFLSTGLGTAYLYQDHHAVVPTIVNGLEDRSAAVKALWFMVGALYSSVYKIARFYPPSRTSDTQEVLEYLSKPINFTTSTTDYEANAYETIEEYYYVFALVFKYFFIAMGVFVVLCTVLAAFNRGRKTQLFWVRLVVIAAIGLGIALLSTIVLSRDLLVNFVTSPWLLPTITLCLFTIVVINGIKFAVPGRFHRSRGEKQ